MKRFRALDINFDSIGLMRDDDPARYFCDPVDLEPVGRTGCDGVHFVLLSGDERVFCVDPAMGEQGTFVLPVGSDFREFLSFVLFCGSADPISQIWWLTAERFQEFAVQDAADRQGGEFAEFYAANDTALETIVKEFDLTPADPFEKVKAMQAEFDPSVLNWSDEYYDVLGLENPRHQGEEKNIQGTEFAAVAFTSAKEESMLPQDPIILLSYVNTKLRDDYSSLDALCDGLDADKAELTEKLSGAGYTYDSEANQFKPV